MVMAGLAAVTETIQILLFLAAIALIVGYVKYYLAVLSYYDEAEYSWCKAFRSDKIPGWLMNFNIGKGAERERLAAVDDCKRKCRFIKESPE
jgi:hypothetical protein